MGFEKCGKFRTFFFFETFPYQNDQFKKKFLGGDIVLMGGIDSDSLKTSEVVTSNESVEGFPLKNKIR